jgi:amino acid adenylation domain-containing protein
MTRHPLTAAQQGLWFLSQIDLQTSAAYNIVVGLRTEGEIDADLLSQTLAIVAQRHEVLRATIQASGGVPWLAVEDAEQARPARISTSRLSLDAALHAESGTPIDTAVGPIYRAVIVRPAGGATAGILFTFPHVIFDEASCVAFCEQIGEIYSKLARHQQPAPAAKTASLAELLQREQTLIGSAEGKQLIESTADRLRGIPGRLALPRCRPAPEGSLVYSAAVAELLLSPEQVAQLALAARRLHTTPAVMLLAAFELLLWRYTGQRDFGICLPLTNRPHEEDRGCLGYLTNLTAVRCRIDPTRAVEEFVAAVAGDMLDVLDACEVPFPSIAKVLKRSGSELQGPLTQLAFNYVKSNRTRWQLGAVPVHLQEFIPRYAKNELKLDIRESHEGARCWFIYDADGFESSVIEDMSRHYGMLLEALAADPQRDLAQLNQLGEAEREHRVARWNNVATPIPRDVCIHQLFESQVEQTPRAVALSFAGTHVNYRELNERANQLAHYLRGRGVGPDTLVALCAERSIEMVVAILAILKAGGAYLPLDPAYPRERLVYMLNDSKASLVLTHVAATRALNLPIPASQTINLLSDHAQWDPLPTDNLPGGVAGLGGSPLAYVIYTSGSTGNPKGVMVQHCNVTRLFQSTQHWFQFDANDTWTLFHSYAFDFSVWEMWGALLYGGRLVIVPSHTARSAEEFYSLLCREGVTVLNQTPSAFRQLVRAHAGSSDSHQLRKVIFGGEALHPAALKPWYGLNPQDCPQLINMYGITETTVHVTYRPITTLDITSASGTSPIGTRIPDLRTYILDESGRAAPIGVAGEIHVSGAGVARGYLHRPELTAERFVPDPLGPPGSRMYRTGDLGRFLPDGALEYLGRIDHQVKIRGFRIELGEIETALARSDLVQEAVVMVYDDGDEDRRLVAYVVPRDPAQTSVAKLRDCAMQALPEYMVPHAWVFLPSLPLTTNGKVDRGALPPPDAARADIGVQYVAPRNATEELLAGLWAEVLKLDRVGVHDDFFALGGHSLSAFQVLSRLNEQLPVRTSFRVLLESPTIAALATRIDTQPQSARA